MPTEDRQLTLEAFVESMKADIDDFAKRWRASHARGSEKISKDCTYREAYPMTMGEGEWFENFMVDQTGGHDGD